MSRFHNILRSALVALLAALFLLPATGQVSSPILIKRFGAQFLALGASTSLSFTVRNVDPTATLTGIAFTDMLPAGLVVSTPTSISGSCDSGTITATAGASTVSLSGASLVAGDSCVFSVNVTGITAGEQDNSVAATSTNGGTGNTASASVTVLGPPTISKSFGAATLAIGGSTSLSFTVTNPNTAGSITGITFTDTLPAGLVVSTPSVVTGTCGVGTITATAGASSVSLTGGTRPAGASCTFSVSVTGTTAGVQNNSVTITDSSGGASNTATASTTVLAPPSISKSFGAATIPVGGSTSLSFTVTNPAPNTGPLTGLSFTDTLPAGLVVSTPNGLTGTCGAGTITATAGASTVSLSGAARAGGVSCTFSVSVTGITAGAQNNSVTVTSSNGGTGNTATASIAVVNPPTITKSFGAATVGVGLSTSLSFTVTNPNSAGTLAGIAFTDTLPAGLVVSTPSVITGTCDAGTITATAGASTVSLSGATRAAGASCTFSVSVTGVTAGVQNNSVTVTSTNGGTGNTATASVTVVNPPTISKSFGAAMIAVGGSTSLSFTVTNPNSSGSLTGIAFTDTLPPGLVVSTPSVVTGTCDGGTITATAGAALVSLAGATRAAGASCTFSVSVTATTAGVKNNAVQVTSTNGGAGNTATASITVTGPPSITKTFGAAAVAVGGSTSLSFTVSNPNASSSLTGVAFTDTLPSGLVVSTPNGLTGACGGGTITATAGSSSVSLSGATLTASASCTFSVNITGTTEGVQNNSVTVTSNNAGTGNTSTASIAVLGPPSITKSFGSSTVAIGGSASLSFTINNSNTTMTLTGVAFTDVLPAGLAVSTPNGLTGSCGGGAITATAGSSSVSLSGASLAPSASCTFSVNVTGTAGGLQSNSVMVTSANGGAGNTSTATITVVIPPSISKSFTALAIPVGSSTNLTFSITNPNAATSLSGVTFTDTLPAGLLVATPNGLTSTCNGGTTATSGSNTVTLTGASLAAGATCTVSVNVVGANDGTQINSVTVSSDNGGQGNTATAQITVGDAFSINYAANLNIGDSFVNFTNSGSDVAGGVSQNICVNLYVFDPAEELIGCCSCSVTPNGLQSVSVVNALINKPLTPNIPTAIVIKAVATVGATCNPSSVTPGSLASGLKSWRATLHQNTALTTPTYSTTETPLVGATLMPPELTHITSTCGFIQSNGSNFGVCGGCSAGGLGASTSVR